MSTTQIRFPVSQLFNFSQRANVGLIATEGTQPSDDGQGTVKAGNSSAVPMW